MLPFIEIDYEGIEHAENYNWHRLVNQALIGL